jgi:hypothetical protein
VTLALGAAYVLHVKFTICPTACFVFRSGGVFQLGGSAEKYQGVAEDISTLLASVDPSRAGMDPSRAGMDPSRAGMDPGAWERGSTLALHGSIQRCFSNFTVKIFY